MQPAKFYPNGSVSKDSEARRKSGSFARRFFESESAVLTASSEQVRRPIYRDAMEQWQNLEPYLSPLKQALGSALTEYPFD